MRSAANAYAQRDIRVNSAHPTRVATPMIFNEHMVQTFAGNPQSRAMTGNLNGPMIAGSWRATDFALQDR